MTGIIRLWFHCQRHYFCAVAAMGRENQVPLKIAVRLAKKRNNPGILCKRHYQGVPVSKVKFPFPCEKPMQSYRINRPHRVHAASSRQYPRIFRMPDYIHPAWAYGLFHKLRQWQSQDAIPYRPRLQNHSPLALLHRFGNLFPQFIYDIASRTHFNQ